MLAFRHTFAFSCDVRELPGPFFATLLTLSVTRKAWRVAYASIHRLWAGGRFLFAEAADKREGSTRMLRLFLIPEFASPFLGRPEVPVSLSPGGIRVVRVLDACARPLRRRWARARAPGSPTLL